MKFDDYTTKTVEGARAKRFSDQEFADVLARMLAERELGRAWHEIGAPAKGHFLKWSWVCVRGVDLSSNQISTAAMALGTAAQALADAWAELEGHQAPVLWKDKDDLAYYVKLVQPVLTAYVKALGAHTLEDEGGANGTH